MSVWDSTNPTSLRNHIFRPVTKIIKVNLLLHAFVKEVLSLEPQDGKYDCAAVDGGESVAEGEHQDVFDTVLVWRVVAAE